MKNDIGEKCSDCHFFVDKNSYTCCHLNPPQFQLTTAQQFESTGRKSWWTFPYVRGDEIACGCFEPRWE